MFDHASSSWAADTANGGAGIDRLRWQDQASHYDVYNVDVASSVFTRGGASMGSFTDFEKFEITSSWGADTLKGGANTDSFQSSEGDDLLDGRGGDDFLHAGAGNDQVIGGE